MNHQPFEELIFAGTELSLEDGLRLQLHLQSCEQCLALAEAWRQVETKISTSSLVEPAPGFSTRWQQRLRQDNMRIQRRQSLLVFAGGVGLALVFLILLALTVLFAYDSPLEWLLTLSNRLVVIFTLAETFQMSLIILQSAIPLGWWLSAGVAVMALCLLWIFSLQKLALNGRHPS
jgi:lysylphosphatidylglycerol synthetase-like protein (DUF2156 family)